MTIIAAQMHNETPYTSEDISETNLEFLIDNTINHINLMAGARFAISTGIAEGFSYYDARARACSQNSVQVW